MTPRTTAPILAILNAVVLATVGLAAGACGAGEPAGDPPPPAAAEKEVEYEPAYPEEVSSETLSEEDEAQQAVRHTHDGDTHTHEEGEEHDGDDGGHDH